MADLFKGLEDVAVEMCQITVPCDVAEAIQSGAHAEARLLGGGGGDSKTQTISLSAHALCAAAFFVMTVFCLWRVMEPLHKVQSFNLRTRLYWCIKCNVYVCVVSCFLNLLHTTNFEVIMYGAFGFSSSSLIKPLEYIITCPAMMLILVVMAGDTVPARRQLEVMACTTCILVLGFAAQMSTNLPVKMMFYVSGVTFFIVLMSRIEMNVRQHSGGKESLFSGGFSGSAYKKLCLKTAMTWVLFPIWFLLSPEGLGVVQDLSTALLVTAALNIYSKAFYVVYIVIIYDIYVGEDNLLNKPAHGKGEHHSTHSAAEAAARLGPNEAITALEKSMKTSQESINQIRKLMIRDEVKKEEALRAEQLKLQQSEMNSMVMYGGMAPQGMADVTDISARQVTPDMVAAMNLQRAPSSSLPPSARQQPMAGPPMMGMTSMAGGPPMVPTLPLNGNNGYMSMNRGGSFKGNGAAEPDYMAPQGMNAQLQQMEMHAAAVPMDNAGMNMGMAPQYLQQQPQDFMAAGPQMPQLCQPHPSDGMVYQMQGQLPPLQQQQVYMQQQQQQQQMQQQPMAMTQSPLSPRSAISSMPDPDVKHCLEVGAPVAPPVAPPCSAGMGATPEAQGLVQGGIGVNAPAKEMDGLGSSNWRKGVEGFPPVPPLRMPVGVPAPPQNV